MCILQATFAVAIKTLSETATQTLPTESSSALAAASTIISPSPPPLVLPPQTPLPLPSPPPSPRANATPLDSMINTIPTLGMASLRVCPSLPAFVSKYVSPAQYANINRRLLSYPGVVYNLAWLTKLSNKTYISATEPSTMCKSNGHLHVRLPD